MRSRTILWTAALAALLEAAALGAGAPRVIAIKGTDDMRYSVKRIEAAPGESLRIVLSTASAMPKESMAHNFVLVAMNVDLAAFANASAVARRTGFIAPAFKDKVLAATALAGGGETVEVSFQAPIAPGTYAYLCTFPGHFAGGMQGQLIVK